MAALSEIGYDLHESGYDKSDKAAQDLALFLQPTEAAKLRAAGIQTELQEYEAAAAKDPALGDSPNPYFNVWRSYSEPGGIMEQMTALANANPDVMKLEQIGTSLLGKPLMAIKMTANAREVPDGTRTAILFSATNHAREWLAADQGRRLPLWFAAHKNDPEIKALIQDRELWFLPIMNVDGYDFTFTCGTGTAQVACDYRTPPAGLSANRQWRKTLRDNNANGIYGDGQDGVDPNRNYPAKRGIDEEGASNTFNSGTYRGPYPLSEPENLAVDRLQRRVKFVANINYHTDGQLLLTPVSYTTDYAPPDATIFNALTGTDGDSSVFPYQPQRSSDLYESNGDTIDNAYVNYGIIGWTPEMETCTSGGDFVGCPGFSYPDREDKVSAVFDKNLHMVLNVVKSMKNLARPRNFDNDPSTYQVKQTRDIQPNLFHTSFGGSQQVEAIVRKELGPSDIRVSVVGVGNSTAVIPMETAPAGERYGEIPGYYFERRRATIPAQIGTRVIQAGDTVNVIVMAGGLQSEFRYKVISTQKDATKKRVLVVAAEDYTGTSPNVTPGYATAPRYLNTYKTALEGLGYEVDTYDIDAPPTGPDTSPNGINFAPIKYPTNLGVLSHFDAVVYETGDDFGPQDASNTNPRRMTSATAQTGSQEMASWAHHTMLQLRDYANEGGKLVVAGRNAHQPFTNNNPALNATGPWTWTPDKLWGFFYPENNGGDDDFAGTAFQRSRGSSNDTWQNYLGVVGRQSGIGVATSTSTATNNNNPVIAGYPVAAKAGGLFDGMAPIVIDESATGDVNESAAGVPLPLPKQASRLRAWGASNEILRKERVEADFVQPIAYPGDAGAIVSTRDSVTFGFGLEQVSSEVRSELLKRSLAHIVPAAADTTPPVAVGWKYPADFSTATPLDPVETELTAYDERGDMDKVELYLGSQLLQTARVYPFQFRYLPPASAVGTTVQLTAKAYDAAGNVTTSAPLNVRVVSGAPNIAPNPVVSPTMNGVPAVGQTLSCVNGGFLNNPTIVSATWLIDGDAIAGATTPTYVPVNSDVGREISCRYTATNPAGVARATSRTKIVSAAGGTAPGGPDRSRRSGWPGRPQWHERHERHQRRRGCHRCHGCDRPGRSRRREG